MLFNKNDFPNSSPEGQIAVIGTSPLALFLADVLQNNRCTVTVLAGEPELEHLSRAGSFAVRSTRFQNRHADFRFAAAVDFVPDFCFLASKPEYAAVDMLFLTDPQIKQAPLVNLSSFYNRRFFKQFGDVKEIRGYFNGWLNLEKNTLQLLDRLPKLEVCGSSETAAALRRLFGDSRISVSFSHNAKSLFWEHFAPFFLGNLLLSAYGGPLTSRLSAPEIRPLVDAAASEIVRLAKNEKASLDSGEILARLYSFADEYRGEFSSPRGFAVLTSLLPDIDRFSTPALYRILTAAAKKY